MSKTIFLIAILTIIIFSSCNKDKLVLEVYEMQKNAKSKVYWEYDTLPPMENYNIYNIKGEGVINRIWCTFLPTNDNKNNYLGRALVLNIYWDGSETPAVSAPLADFFCQPLKLQEMDNHFFNSSNKFCVLNSLIPMPFRKSARIEITNDTESEILFWFGTDVEFKKISKESLYLHAYWHRFNDISVDTEFTILPEIQGNGRYLGTHIALNQQNVQERWPWYTRPVQIYLDPENESDKPSVYINTLDDFVCSGWWARKQEHKAYSSSFTGRPLVQTDSTSNLSVVMYRYHVQDPLWFNKSVSFKVGPAYWEAASGDWSTTSFFYLDKTENSLPVIQDIRIRTLGLEY